MQLLEKCYTDAEYGIAW